MSEQPPTSFGGHPNYTQQWPPAHPAMFPPNFPIPPELSAMNPQSNHATSFDYNLASMDANSRIPGAGDGLNSAGYFPHQLPFFNPFDPSRFPPNFSPMHFPPMGYPPIPMPTGSSNAPLPQQPSSQQTSQATFIKPPQAKKITIRAPPSREEGEVSESVDERSLESKRKASRQYSDLEEGETISSSGRSSRRSSGSPYNPPLSVSADPGIIGHAMEPNNFIPDAVPSDPKPVKSAARLRIQAQGALLSLAPHNIRYKELVAEGVSPIVLKRLYEEVGIKVTLDSDPTLSTHEKPSSATQPSSVTPLGKEKRGVVKPNIPAPRTAMPATPASKAGKPMERKELIAQMLAEKAAKMASKEPSPTGSTISAPAVSEETRPPLKEKSKAQTDLARQRIEELKQKALLKTQQKLQESLAPVSQESPTQAIHHPLPVRPPIPESHTPAALPGLLMAGSGGPQDVASDHTPVSRSTHRKRPLASDFDEPSTHSKKHFDPTANRFKPAEKLIIAISDDESLYGDDEDDQMELDSSSEQEPATIISSAISKVPSQTNIPGNRTSTSTPQTTIGSNDQGQIQSKDLQIQEMRRKIAELELRRKSKLAASRTQSPRNFDESSAPSIALSSAADAEASDAGVSVASRDDPVPERQHPVPEAPSTNTNAEPARETAPLSPSRDSDSDGSAMQESDDSSSESSDSSEDEDETSHSPEQIDAQVSSEPMDIDPPMQSQTENSEKSDDSSQNGPSQRETSVESEAYEPPEPDTEARSDGSSYSPPPFSPAPDPVDITTALTPSFDATQPTAELTNAPHVSGASQMDLQVGTLGTENPPPNSVRENSTHKFTPYTSPLRSFKAYRYHPNYAEDIPSGYRSLTYSHNIDSMKSLCPYEVAGGVCNDRSCGSQHLRDISLSDDKILIQMGSAREGQTEEEEETYLAGLKEIINDLRRDKVKDFNTVATEIAAYRRRFLQDPSRVLSL
ncbi:unnamed protein product [Penicillium salamii]|uniref:Putative zinc-finger domain-containing protein n=1 Tax=Penicillium salamii TaxID=1612424 RepID=A0A9W4NWA8_9EURO|nr:unnamed protein product [Penicillium salamii]